MSGNILMVLTYMRATPVSLIARLKISGEDRVKQTKDQIMEAQKLGRTIITKNPNSNNIDKEKVLQNIRKSIVIQ